MRQIPAIGLHNIIYYKDAFVDLTHPGVTVIKGRNLNVSEKNAMNGAGKSLLWAPIPAIRYSSAPIASKNKQAAKKDLFALGTKDDPARIDFYLQDQGHEYKFSKYAPGEKSAFGFKVFRDGKDLNVRTGELAEKLLARLFPLSEEEFFSYVYLDGRRGFTLHLGSTAERYKFFSGLFHLNSFDSVKSLCATKRKELREETIKLQASQDELYRLNDEISQSPGLKKLKAAKIKFTGLVEEHKQRSEHLLQQITEIDRQLDQTQALQKVLPLYESIFGSKEIDRELVKNELALVNKRLKKVRAARERWEQARQVQTRREKLEAELEGINVEGINVEGIDDKLSSLQERVDQIKSKRHKYETLLEGVEDQEPVNLSSLEKQLKQYSSSLEPKKLKKILDTTQRLTGERDAQRRQLRQERKALSTIEGEKRCSRCGSKLNPKHVKSELDRIKKELKDLERAITTGQEGCDTIARYLTGLEEQEQADKAIAQARNLRGKLKKLKPTDKLERRIHKLKRAKVWAEELAELPKVESVKYSEKREKKLTQRREELQKIQTLVSTLKSTKVYSTKRLKQKKVVLKQDYGTAIAEMQKYSSKSTAAKGDYRRIKAAVARRKELRKRLKRADQLMRDQKIYEMLETSYSNKGLKQIVIKALAKEIETRMNDYAALIFNEPYTFSWHVSRNKFDILAHRPVNSGKKKGDSLVSDVRTLSGSEGKAFNLLVLLAVLPMIPSNRRTNIIILDEMDSNMDAPTKAKFIDNFIPTLARMVPSVIVVTPHEDEYSDARVLVAVKRGSTSKILPLREANDVIDKFTKRKAA